MDADVTPIRLGNREFEGDNSVYLVRSDGRTALIDAGTATPGVRQGLRAGLADAGASFAEVDEVWLTHWHWDHVGLAGEIQEESGATVRIHEADAPLVADGDAFPRTRDRRGRRFEEWGVPEAEQAELESLLDEQTTLGGDGADVTPFSDGDALSVGDAAFEVLHLPGHAAGLSAFVDDGANAAFVGDAVLPKYTPNVGGADLRVERPLAQYADSLVRLADRDLAVAYPGHRDSIDDPAGRALETLDHHRDRTRRVLDVLATHGPCDAWTVSAHLFGDLSGIHVLHGPGEAFAHLDHLAAAGAVTFDGREYALREDANGDGVDVDALFPRTER